ncbi:50S ribosomal protein L23 [Hufsiella ginkgonis]|uniref:Large ribosomal subunit protein uL23 n=1 Tax=Hufsiella ginkgonis TaxID=2695274 RepID=A0A7K1XZ84_9SPHI|nr:50S ribosomal protein L23 [Hufsiella ginkgonis]MXV16128.1 50S ribosomal protein L23 [Hufsiella ginkgonis]
MEILKKPILTEKASLLTEKLNRYSFKVNPKANKLQIKQAIESMYNVSIESINTIVVSGKKKTRYTKAGFVSGNAPKYKKAIITLKEGETIDFYSNI